MAIVSEDRRKVWECPNCDRTQGEVPDVQPAGQVVGSGLGAGCGVVWIPRPNWAGSANDEGVDSETRARSGNWATAKKIDASGVFLTRSGGYTVANEVDWEDALELPWAAVDRTRSRQVYDMRHQIDTAIYDAVFAMPSSTITGGVSNATFVSRAAPWGYTIAGTAKHPVMEVIDRFSLAMFRADAIDGESSPTGQAGVPFMILQPELIASLRDWMRAEKLAFDPLTMELLRDNPGMAGRGYIGNLSGVQLYSWNHLAIPVGSNNWAAYAGITQAAAVGMRPTLTQYFMPQDNQVSDHPAHLLRQAVITR